VTVTPQPTETKVVEDGLRQRSPTNTPTRRPSPTRPAPTGTPTRVVPTPTQQPVPTPDSSGTRVNGTFIATRYGESYNGLPLGCGGGIYSSYNTGILAAPPARYQNWPCGTRLLIT